MSLPTGSKTASTSGTSSTSQTSTQDTRDYKLRAPEFDGTYDLEIFLTQFEDVAALSEWPDTIKAIKP